MRFPTASIASAVLAVLLVSPGTTVGQQYVVDDASIVDHRSCQVEAWHGERASWMLPACQLIRNVEVAVGAGFVYGDDGHRETEYAVEVKTLFRPLVTDSWGVGLVAGVGPNPSAVPGERRFGDVYAFVPASLSLVHDRLVLHGNVGWVWDRDGREHDGHVHEAESQHLTWGVRSDIGLTDRFTFIGELSGEDRLLPEFQVGVRTHFPAAGLEVDVSWGGHLQDDLRGAGLTVGIAMVSGQIF
jgi:hypothetical protein